MPVMLHCVLFESSRAVSEQTVYTQAAPPRYQNPPIRIEEFTDQETVTEISQIKLRVKIDGPPNAKVM